jgi:hypothetical protein
MSQDRSLMRMLLQASLGGDWFSGAASGNIFSDIGQSLGILPTKARRQTEAEEKRDAFQSRMDAGEVIPPDEILSAPVSHLPSQLLKVRSNLRFDAIVAQQRQSEAPLAMPSDGDGAHSIRDRWQSERESEPESVDLGDRLKTAIQASSQTDRKPDTKPANQPKPLAKEVMDAAKKIVQPNQKPSNAAPPAGNQKRPAKSLPAFYHQADPSGNTMASLLAERDSAKGAAAKRAIKDRIETWTAHFDPRRQGTAPTSVVSAQSENEATIKAKWKAERDSESKSSDEVTTTGTRMADIRQSAAMVDQVTSAGGPVPPQPPAPTPMSAAKAADTSAPTSTTTPVDRRTAGANIPKRWKEANDAQPPQTDRERKDNTLAVLTRAQDAVSGGRDLPRQAETSMPTAGDTEPAKKKPVEKQRSEPNESDQESRFTGSDAIDGVQLGLDGIGIADPTPISDGLNTAISLGRAFTDPERRGEHLKNAAISAVSMVPYVGDTAKILKAKGAVKTFGKLRKGMKGGDGIARTKAAGESFASAMGGGIGGGIGSLLVGAGFGGDGDDDGDDREPERTPPIGRPPGDGNGNLPPSDGDDREKNNQEDPSEELGEGFLNLIPVVGKVVTTIAGLLASLKLLNTGVLSINRDLAQYNGTIASAYAKSDVADLQRDIRKADSLDGPLSRLAEEQSEFKDTLARVTTPLQAIATESLVKLTGLLNAANKLAPIIDGIGYTLELVAEMIGASEGKDEAGNAWQKFFQDVSDGKFDAKRPAFHQWHDGPSLPLLNREDMEKFNQ